LTGFFIYLFVKNTLSIPVLRQRYKNYSLIAFFAAVLWLVHPIQTQSVTYIVQRMTSLAVMFYILSLFLYVKGRLAVQRHRKSRLWFAGCILTAILAIGCKQIAATLPLFILLYEWFFFQELSMSWLKRCLPYIAGVIAFFFVLALLYLGTNPFQGILHDYSYRDFTMAERLLTQFRVVVYYIGLLFFPHPGRLNLDHHFTISHSLTEPPATLLCLLVIAGLIILAVCMARKQRLLSFCILWYFGNLVMESSILGLELVFEHRLYLPSMFVSVAAVALVYRFIKPNWVKVTVFCTAAVLLGVWAYERNKAYADGVTLWQDCVNKSPKKARAMTLRPDYADVYYNLGVVLKLQGRLKEAVEQYRSALRLKPDFTKVHYNLGNTLSDLGRLDESIEHYRQALQLKPNHAKAANNLGMALRIQGKLDDAVVCLRQALQIEPDNAGVHYNLADTLRAQGRLDEAINHYYKVLELRPDYTMAQRNLEITLQLLQSAK
jgi:tetratricopeptide (TPR) repeat protein